MQPASHGWPMERRGVCSPGTRWHSVAVLGRAMGRLPLEVLCMVSPLAAVILTPMGVGVSFKSGVVGSARLSVQPVSAAM
jgi:hypothetical protein